MIRVSCYIDGFNVYHALDDFNRASAGTKNHYKWLDLMALMRVFTDPAVHEISTVKFFTAYPTWNADKEARHRTYTDALQHVGVEVIHGQFKSKDCYCKNCRTTYKAREEKESDVNIAMHLINDAHVGAFDQAFLVTNDSDLLGPVRMLRTVFPAKKIKIIAPPFRRHSKELWAAANGQATIVESHVAACRLPDTAIDAGGAVIFTRPTEYAEPV